MRFIKYKIFFLLVSLFVVSCSSKKQVIYLQDSSFDSVYSSNFIEYKIRPDDILKIDVNSDTPEAAMIFSRSGMNLTTNTKENMIFNGYQVDSEGYINFPILGKIKVIGLTVTEIRDYLHEKISKDGYLLDPFIDVKTINLNFTILGEVNRPGSYEFLKNNLSILEAIGYAGDLTINGKRKDIRVLRKKTNTTEVISLDLTSTDFITKNFQIFPGDVIIVNPNMSRVKNAGIIGNSGTLLTLLSFILSSLIVINN